MYNISILLLSETIISYCSLTTGATGKVSPVHTNTNPLAL